MVRILGMDDVKNLLSMKETLGLVETAFREKTHLVQMPCKSYLFFEKYEGDLRVMPSYLLGLDICGVKIVNVHPCNSEKYNLPTIMATILLYDPKTGILEAIMDGTWITSMRTASAAGIATKYLARRDAKTIGIVGSGSQAIFQIEALREVISIELIKVYDVQKEKAEEFARTISSKYDIEIRVVGTTEEAVRGVDVLVTLTPVRVPIIKNEWVEEGMHINAIGADAPGKEELEPTILRHAKIVVDDWKQASHSGEINVPFREGLITEKDMHAELSEIVAGRKDGRVSNKEITVFDSTGLSITDVVTGWHVYELAKQKEIGTDRDAFWNKLT